MLRSDSPFLVISIYTGLKNALNDPLLKTEKVFNLIVHGKIKLKRIPVASFAQFI